MRRRAARFMGDPNARTRHLDRLQEATIEQDGRRVVTRTASAGQVGRVFQAVGVAPPPNLRHHAG